MVKTNNPKPYWYRYEVQGFSAPNPAMRIRGNTNTNANTRIERIGISPLFF
jgi:hypothetical protein